MDIEQMEAMLPVGPREAKSNPKKLVYLAIAPPKFGKTTFFGDVPNSVIIAFERGYQFQKTPIIFIDHWDAARFEPYIDEEGVLHTTMKLLEKVLTVSDKYDFLTFDTADMAAKKCLDYHCKLNGWRVAKDGGDFGVGHDIAQNTPFRQLVGSLMSTGRGIAFNTHVQINTTDFNKGKKSKKETTLPGGIHKFLYTQADIIFNGQFGVRQKGNNYRDRIWQTEGDEETLAGNRTREIFIPQRYIIDPERPWAQWEEFFNDPTAGPEAEAALKRSIGRRQPAPEDQAEAEVQAEAK